MKNIIEMLESILGGSTACLSYLTLSHILDNFISPKVSNLLSLLVSSVINFVIQTYIFSHGKITKENMGKYLVVNLVELLTNQLALVYLLENRTKIVNTLPNIYGIIKDHYNTLSRILITSVLFFILSYPARKYWIYKDTLPVSDTPEKIK